MLRPRSNRIRGGAAVPDTELKCAGRRGRLAFVGLVAGAHPLPLWQTVSTSPGVAAAVLTRGPWDLVLQLAEDANEEQAVALLTAIGHTPGVDWARLSSCTPLAAPGGSAAAAAHLQVLVDLAPGAAATVGAALATLPGLEELLLVGEDEQLLVGLGGETWRSLETLVLEQVRPLAGVRQARRAQVVRLPQVQVGERLVPEPVPATGMAGTSVGPLVLSTLQRLLWRYQPGAGELIPLLQQLQDLYGFIPRPAIELAAGITGTPASEIYGIITFYAQFRLTPLGRYVIRQCHGTACHVNGAQELQGVIEDELEIAMGQTDAQGLFTLAKVACLGCCSLAPVLMINEETHGRLDPAKMRRILKGYRKQAREQQA